jgi:two-component system, OmpR family, phosphate regulon sensor histidine kinase PhoR
MKFNSPGKLSLIASLIVSVLSVLIYGLISLQTDDHIEMLAMIGGGVAVFFLSFIIFRYILENFIYEKIKLIYKTIHDLKMPKGQRREMIFSKDDIIGQTNREVKEWASEREKEIDNLKRLEAYRREFLGNVSHELKTPIFNIQGYVLTLLDGGLEDPAINRKYLLRSEESINRMISIIDDLESISRLESGELQLHFSDFDMVALAKEVMEFLEIKAEKRHISFHFGRSYDSPVMVYADRKQIRQVITNLVANSINYGREGGHTKISFFDMDEHILTEVTDSGVGIPREELPRIFERFYRGDKSRSRYLADGGSGLGLAIVKHIVEAHKQTINVRSTPGVGSTFAFTLKKGKQAHALRRNLLSF